jgi:putative FmdB family regulatory protein
MPFYEYECSSCKHHVEVLQKISDAPLLKCPECGKKRLTRLISAPVFRLKGGGWYETDFKSDQEKKRNLAGADEAPPESKSETQKESQKESKSESKEDSKAAAKADSTSDAKPAQTKTEAKPADKKAETASKSASKNRTNLARTKPAKARPAAKKAGRR